MNSRLTAKERNLVKGAIRRIFSRSELRKRVLDNSIILGYTDPSRPRVKTWCRCKECKKPEAKSLIEIDHINPIVPLDSALEYMTWDEVVNRIWSEEENLQPLCITCHDEKTKLERKLRSKNKKERKENELKKR